MSSVLARSRGQVARQVARLWRIDAPLTATTLLMLVVLVACGLGLWLDPRVLLGAPVWLKPAKFAASITIYALTLIGVFSQLPGHVRMRRVVGRMTAAAMLIEVGIITFQAARGTTSHFNVSTPLNTGLWVIMGVAIVAQTLATVAVAVALFREKLEDPALGWALRLGMAITIAGAFMGGAMAQPTRAQLAEMRAGRVAASGAHTVGAPDGGAGLPVTGWSREHGDLRIAHFMGLHALQVLPLFAFALRRTRTRRDRQVSLVFSAAGSYAGLIAIVFWQGLRGQSLIAPDATTGITLLVWVGLSATLVFRPLAPRPLASGAPVIVS